ncbi:MAG: hypothetical protein ACIALR_11445 [Blastopirellula sp. JB062]
MTERPRQPTGDDRQRLTLDPTIDIVRLEAARRARIEAETQRPLDAIDDESPRQPLRLPASEPIQPLPASGDDRQPIPPPSNLVDTPRSPRLPNADRGEPPNDGAQRSIDDSSFDQPTVERPSQTQSRGEWARPPTEPSVPLQVDVKRELVVRLQEDSETLVDSVVRQVEGLLAERDQRLLQQIEQRLIDLQAGRRAPLKFAAV